MADAHYIYRPWPEERRIAASERVREWRLTAAGVIVPKVDPAVKRAEYRAEMLANRARIEAMLYAPENIWKPKPKPLKAKPRKVYVSRAKVVLAYPFVPRVREEHADLIAVNALVPRSLPGREDVCQEIMLALLEGQTTLAELKALRGNVSAFIKRFRSLNLEQSGYAISLDQPRFDGTSWHDVLAAPSGS